MNHSQSNFQQSYSQLILSSYH